MMKKRNLLGLSLLSVVLALAGCATSNPIAEDSEVVQRNSLAGDTLASLLKARGNGTTPVIVASAVNLDTLESSSFGRMVGEQVAGRMAHIGVPVVELKMRNTLYLGKGGEYLLSRELKDLTTEHRAAFAVVGTYTVASTDVLVTLKAVNVESNAVVAAHSYSIPKALVRNLLK